MCRALFKFAPMTTPRVLHVGTDLRCKGGIASVLQTYRRNFPEFRHLPTNSPHGTLVGAFVLAGMLAALPVYRMCGYGILHAHGCMGKSYIRKRIVLRWARALGFKTIFHSHGGSIFEYAAAHNRDAMVRFLASQDAVVALSNGWKERFQAEFGLENVHVVFNPVERPSKAVVRKPLAEDVKIKILFLGRICRDKGLVDLVDAVLADLDFFRNNIELVLAGDGPEEEQLSQMIEQYGLNDFVTLPGSVTGEAKDALLRECDVMILPSYIEGMPVGLLEAGFYGMPSIATPVGGVPEIIQDGVNGRIVPVGDVAALAAAIKYYALNREVVPVQGREAARMSEKFAVNRVGEQLSGLYRTI